LIVLEDAKDNLYKAMSRMRTLRGTGTRGAFQVALTEAETLLIECQAIRDEVGHHQAAHGITTLKARLNIPFTPEESKAAPRRCALVP
jgi:hypothetical protein